MVWAPLQYLAVDGDVDSLFTECGHKNHYGVLSGRREPCSKYELTGDHNRNAENWSGRWSGAYGYGDECKSSVRAG